MHHATNLKETNRMRIKLKILAAAVAFTAATMITAPSPADAYQMQHGDAIRNNEGALMAVWCQGPCESGSSICCKSAYTP